MSRKSTPKPKGIRPHGNKWEYSFMYKGQRFYGSADTETAAIALMAEHRKRAEQGHQQAKEQAAAVTLKRAFTLTFSSKWEGTKGEKTAKLNSRTALAYFGEDMDIRKINAVAITEYIEHLRRDAALTNGTINRKVSALHTILQTAQNHGLLTTTPKPQRQKEYTGRIRTLTEKEEREFLEHLQAAELSEFMDAVTLLLDTGMRTGELLKLRVKDILFHVGTNGTIQIWETKANLSRSVPLTARASEVLKHIVSRATGTNDLLFPHGKQWIRTYWDKVKKFMGLSTDTEFVPHCLRHTTATRLLQRGVALIDVKTWLGHKTINTTMRYLHVNDPERLQDAMRKLEGKSENRFMKVI